MRTQLAQAGVLGTIEAGLAVRIARVIDQGGLGRPGASALPKLLREALAGALTSGGGGNDALDDLYGGTVSPIRPEL